MYLRRSTTKTIQVGPYLDASDGVTPLNSLTPSIQISKSGGTFVARNSSNAPTFDSDGFYQVELDSTDTGSLGTLKIKSFESGAAPVWETFEVIPQAVYDALYVGATLLDVNALTLGASAVNTTSFDESVTAQIQSGLATSTSIDTLTTATNSINTKVGTPAVTVSDDIATIKTSTDTISDTLNNTQYLADQVNTKIGTPVSSVSNDIAAIPGSTWNESMGSHLTAGTVGAKLNAAGNAGDPWGVALPGSYTSGQAGSILGNLDGEDWTSTEREQIRYRLGIDGASDVPDATSHIVAENVNNVITVIPGVPVVTSTTAMNIYTATNFESIVKGADLTGYNKLWFTAKTNLAQYDRDALIQINSIDGLVYINGQLAGEGASSGSIVVADTNIIVSLDETMTVRLPEAYNVKWDIKKITDSGSSIIASGIINIRKTPTITFSS